MPFLILLLTLLAIPPLLPACECFGTGTACSHLADTPVVFLGLVIRDSGEGFGSGPARMRVEEVLHGLPETLREVEVETGALSSCYMRLELNERYMIFGDRDKRNPNLLHNPSCSDSFQVRGNELLLDALRKAERKGTTNLVGQIRKKTGRYGGGAPVAPGTRITAEQDGSRMDTVTTSDGQFSFSGIAPGPWRLRADLPEFVFHSIWPDEPLIVPARGCEVRDLYIVANGRIRGTVRGANGHPIAGVSVQAFEIKENGDVETSSYREAITDAAGGYVIDSLPAQEYVIGVNGHKHSDRLPYAPIFYPQTETRDKAVRIKLAEGEQRDGINLLLSAPRTAAMLVVEAVYEDGRAASGSVARALGLDGITRDFAFALPGRGGILRMPLWTGETYTIEAWFDKTERAGDPGKEYQVTTEHWRGKAGPISLSAPETRIKVVLRLAPKK
jgi:hypothetical protein